MSFSTCLLWRDHRYLDSLDSASFSTFTDHESLMSAFRSTRFEPNWWTCSLFYVARYSLPAEF